MEGQSGLSDLSVISWASAFQGCPLRGVPLYYIHLHYLQQLFYFVLYLVKHHLFHLSLEPNVTVEVSSLPPQTNIDELEAYFEKQGDHTEVLFTANLGTGDARVELSGLTSEGIPEHCFSHLHCKLM